MQDDTPAESPTEATNHADTTTHPGPTADGNAQPPPERERALLVVGIGASAGGLEALQQLLQRFASDGMAYVIYQHLAPDHESVLPEILARHCSLPVLSVENGVSLARDHVYVAPPGMALEIEQGSLLLKPLSEVVRRHPIDAFLTSLARDCGASAIGVILSGAGSDGALGLHSIKEAGGITFAQTPNTATHTSMPQSAIDAGCVDFAMSPLEIGDELMRISAHPLMAVKRLPRLLRADRLERLFRALRHAFGLDFSAYKLNTLERRIARRMALLHLENVDDYATLVEGDRKELNALYSDLLIGVTSFFRDSETFDALKQLAFPRLLEGRDPEAPIRIWVAGCATGEEAYSILICLLEFLDERQQSCKIQVFASDINEQALVKARHAIYPSAIELEVSAARLQRFFVKVDQGYQVSRRVRDLVVFASHNLGKDPPFSRLDLVSCRNVLIYLQPALQRKVLRAFHYALRGEGTLLLGASESVGDASDLFSLVERDFKLYTKKNVASNGVFDFSLGHRPGSNAPAAVTSGAHERRPLISAQQLADRKVLEKFAPAGVIIDERMQIAQFRGQTGRFFSPAPGVATLSVLKLVRPELMVPLRNAILAAQRDHVSVSSELVILSDGLRVGVEVIPLREASDQLDSMLVLFREQSEPEGAQAAAPAPSTSTAAESDERMQQMQRDLLTNKEYLETIILELETANEDLQSANEELQSANEELQSTNEELETSKEELQSSNEELATVNEELHTRMRQLALTKDDLTNVLVSISAPVVIIGADLRIRRFSTAAEKELSLIEGDVGRPVSYLASVLNVPELEALVTQSISTVRSRQQNIRCSNGSWYTLRTTPYRTADHVISGVVIELLGTPSLRRPSEAVDIQELVGKVLSTLPHALMLLDHRLRILWANRAFFDGMLVGAEALGRPLEEVWPSRTSHPALWTALEEAAFAGKPFEGLAVEKPFGRPSREAMKFSAQCIAAEGERPAMTLVVMEDARPSGARHEP